MMINSRNASDFYHKYFRCIPNDNVVDGMGLNKYREELQSNELQNFGYDKANLRGHAVDFPLYFMSKEDLTIRMSQK